MEVLITFTQIDANRTNIKAVGHCNIVKSMYLLNSTVQKESETNIKQGFKDKVQPVFQEIFQKSLQEYELDEREKLRAKLNPGRQPSPVQES